MRDTSIIFEVCQTIHIKTTRFVTTHRLRHASIYLEYTKPLKRTNVLYDSFYLQISSRYFNADHTNLKNYSYCHKPTFAHLRSIAFLNTTKKPKNSINISLYVTGLHSNTSNSQCQINKNMHIKDTVQGTKQAYFKDF